MQANFDLIKKSLAACYGGRGFLLMFNAKHTIKRLTHSSDVIIILAIIVIIVIIVI